MLLRQKGPWLSKEVASRLSQALRHCRTIAPRAIMLH